MSVPIIANTTHPQNPDSNQYLTPSLGIEELPARDFDRVICHIDLDCFYAQVHQVDNPSLIGRPLGVQQQSLVVTTNYPARRAGVKKMCSVQDALTVCPNLLLIPSNMNMYRLASSKIMRNLSSYGLLLERASIDEAYLDLTDAVTLFLKGPEHWNSPTSRVPQSLLDIFQEMHSISSKIHDIHWSGYLLMGYSSDGNKDSIYWPKVEYDVSGNQISQTPDFNISRLQPLEDSDYRLFIGSRILSFIRSRLFSKLNYHTSAGISLNPLLAKLSSDLYKPNSQTILIHKFIIPVIGNLALSSIPNIGRKTMENIVKHPQLYPTSNDPPTLVKHLYLTPKSVFDNVLGGTGSWIFRTIRGYCPRAIVPKCAPKSISVEGWWTVCKTFDQIELCLSRHARELLSRLCQDSWTWNAADHSRTKVRRPGSLVIKWHNQGGGSKSATCAFPTCNYPLPTPVDFENLPKQSTSASPLSSADDLIADLEQLKNLSPILKAWTQTIVNVAMRILKARMKPPFAVSRMGLTASNFFQSDKDGVLAKHLFSTPLYGYGSSITTKGKVKSGAHKHLSEIHTDHPKDSNVKIPGVHTNLGKNANPAIVITGDKHEHKHENESVVGSDSFGVVVDAPNLKEILKESPLGAQLIPMGYNLEHIGYVIEQCTSLDRCIDLLDEISQYSSLDAFFNKKSILLSPKKKKKKNSWHSNSNNTSSGTNTNHASMSRIDEFLKNDGYKDIDTLHLSEKLSQTDTTRQNITKKKNHNTHTLSSDIYPIALPQNLEDIDSSVLLSLPLKIRAEILLSARSTAHTLHCTTKVSKTKASSARRRRKRNFSDEN